MGWQVSIGRKRFKFNASQDILKLLSNQPNHHKCTCTTNQLLFFSSHLINTWLCRWCWMLSDLTWLRSGDLNKLNNQTVDLTSLLRAGRPRYHLTLRWSAVSLLSFSLYQLDTLRGILLMFLKILSVLTRSWKVEEYGPAIGCEALVVGKFYSVYNERWSF